MAAARRAPSPRAQTRVLIVDPHPVVRRGLALLVEQAPSLVACGEANNFHEAMTAVGELLPPDIILVVMSAEGAECLELIKSLKGRSPGSRIVVVSMHDASAYAERALHAGAAGYVTAHEPAEHVIDAIRAVLRDEVYLSDSLASDLLARTVGTRRSCQDATAPLSDREFEIFELIGQGLGTKEIAEKLFVSVKTIETHRAHIKQKLNLAGSSELLQYAIQWTRSDRPEAAHAGPSAVGSDG